MNWLGANPFDDPGNSFAKTEKELEARLPPEVRVHKVPWTPRELLRIGPVGVGGVLSKYTQIARRDIPPGVPHLMTQEMAFLLNARRFRRGVITVYDLHGMLGETDTRTRFARMVDARTNRLGFRHASRIITISGYTKKTLVEHLGVPEERVRVAYVGVSSQYRTLPDLDREVVRRRNGVPEGRKLLLYVGSEHPRKNLATLLEAMARARDRTKVPFVLVKVGNEVFPGGRGLTLDAARRHGVEDLLVFTGRVPNEELVALYNTADAVVFPSLFEGFGLPVAEAMRCGAPVICSNVTSIPEVAGDAALLHDPRDAGTLTSHLVDVLENGRRDLVPKGIAQSKKFDWQSFADAHAEAYREAAAEAL